MLCAACSSSSLQALLTFNSTTALSSLIQRFYICKCMYTYKSSFAFCHHPFALVAHSAIDLFFCLSRGFYCCMHSSLSSYRVAILLVRGEHGFMSFMKFNYFTQWLVFVPTADALPSYSCCRLISSNLFLLFCMHFRLSNTCYFAILS